MFGFKINVDLQDRSLWYTAFKHDIEASVFPFLSYMLVIVRMSHAYEIPLYIAMHSTGWYKTTILSRRKKKSKETKNARHRTWPKTKPTNVEKLPKQSHTHKVGASQWVKQLLPHYSENKKK